MGESVEPTEAEIDTVVEEFGGDLHAAIRALLHDLAVLALDRAITVSCGNVRGGWLPMTEGHPMGRREGEPARVGDCAMTTVYLNTPTVVVVIVPCDDGLLLIRRTLPGEGMGTSALPGGYQTLGQTWQEAGAAEVREETGVIVDPAALRGVAVVTTPDRRKDLIVCKSPFDAHDELLVHDHEVSEVLVVRKPVETAFLLHTHMVQAFFTR